MLSLYNIEYSEVDVQWSGSINPLYLQNLQDRRLHGSQGRSGLYGKENLFEPRFLGRPAQNSVRMPTELSVMFDNQNGKEFMYYYF